MYIAMEDVEEEWQAAWTVLVEAGYFDSLPDALAAERIVKLQRGPHDGRDWATDASLALHTQSRVGRQFIALLTSVKEQLRSLPVLEERLEQAARAGVRPRGALIHEVLSSIALEPSLVPSLTSSVEVQPECCLTGQLSCSFGGTRLSENVCCGYDVNGDRRLCNSEPVDCVCGGTNCNKVCVPAKAPKDGQ